MLNKSRKARMATLSAFVSTLAFANVENYQFSLKEISTAKSNVAGLVQLAGSSLHLTSTKGEAQLPYYSKVVQGNPHDISVTIDRGPAQIINNLVYPAQAQDCRCSDKTVKTFSFRPDAYRKHQMVRKEFLGFYRGIPLTRVSVIAADIDYQQKTTSIYPDLKLQIESPTLSEQKNNSQYDVLVVTPEKFVDALSPYVQLKEEQNLTVKTVTLETTGKSKESIKRYLDQEFSKTKFQYVLFVGSDDIIPSHSVQTQFSRQTPSDYPYFLFDKRPNDIIPDVFYGRLVATTAEEVQRQISKWSEYQHRSMEASQFLRAIGISSAEGDSPSDRDYIMNIKKEAQKHVKTAFTYFYEGDVESSPEGINHSLEQGTSWLVYIGHGSGTSWASTNEEYATDAIEQLKNNHVVKPVILDVACANGPLKNGFFGSTWVNAKNAQGAIGATVYLGATVNISWHPPAKMVTGMIKEKFDKNLESIGEIYHAGQIYLSEHHSDLGEVQDNLEWYHIFGDPTLAVHFE